MRKIFLLLFALLQVNGFALISTAAKYKLNNQAGHIPSQVQLGTLIQDAEGLAGPALADGKILVGNSSGVSAAVTPSGDVTISNAGVTAIGSNKVLNAMIAPAVRKYVDVTVSTAEILALNTTPKTLVAAPGAGLVNIVEGIVATMTYNSVAYSCNAAGLIVKYTDGSGADVGSTLTQGFCQSSANAIQSVRAAATALTPVANAALVLHAGAANPTTGDSDIKVRVYYYQVPNPIP